MTFNELLYFLTGIFWGIFIVKPIWNVLSAIYKNAKNADEIKRSNNS